MEACTPTEITKHLIYQYFLIFHTIKMPLKSCLSDMIARNSKKNLTKATSKITFNVLMTEVLLQPPDLLYTYSTPI